ncbi:MAG: lysylphosphatidylglycerol synthase transmembrane domain-containing protein [Chloroflexota bacterium]
MLPSLRSRPQLVAAARWAFGLAIVGLLLLRLDAGAVARALQRVDFRLAAPAILGLIAIHLLGAVAWHDLSVRLARVRLRWWPTITHYYAAQAVGSLTPANLGADAYRLAAGRNPSAGWTTLLVPILVQRVTSQVALSLVALAALAVLPASASTLPVLLLGAGLLIGSSGVLWLLRHPRLLGGISRLLPERLRPGLYTDAVPSRDWLAALTNGTSLALAFHLGSIAMVYGIVVALGGYRDPGPVLACIAIARLSILIPLSPSGLGFQEAALSVLFTQIGLTPELALATAILNRLALLGTMALGAALIVSGRTGTLTHRFEATQRGATAD